jgi:hypothetical protein
MPVAPMRMLLGFTVGALAILTFHQGMWEALHLFKIPKLIMPVAYPLVRIAPFGLPHIVSLCLWGGLYGAAFGFLMPRFALPLWACGLILGAIAAVVEMAVITFLAGMPIGAGWTKQIWIRTVLLNEVWGLGVGMLTPLFIAGIGGWTAQKKT